MTLFIEQCLNGLQFGLLLFLLAAGLTLVFGIMDLVNLAHGSLYMLGAYFAATFAVWTGSFVFGAVLALSTTFYFKPFGEGIQVVMIGAVSALVGTAMLVAMMLDYPYSGSIAVPSAPFKVSTLVLLSGG